MGVSIHMNSYDYHALATTISDIADAANTAGRSAQEFIDRVLPEFGVVAGDKFVILYNEYYEEYNNCVEFWRAIDLYFGIENTYLSDYRHIYSANAYEVFEELGIEPIKSDEHEEEDY
jgi:histidinol phosphatase-like PHP family hydrolase